MITVETGRKFSLCTCWALFYLLAMVGLRLWAFSGHREQGLLLTASLAGAPLVGEHRLTGAGFGDRSTWAQ